MNHNNKWRTIFILVCFAVIALISGHDLVSATGLNDISGHWGENNIRELVELGAINGYPDGTFKPNNTISLAEFLTVSVKTLITDVKEPSGGHWASGVYDTALTHGVLKPDEFQNSTTTFNRPISREDMALIIMRLNEIIQKEAPTTINNIQLHLTDFTNVSSSRTKYVEQAFAKGLIGGRTGGLFDPKGNLTRAEAATVILRLIKNQTRLEVKEPPLKQQNLKATDAKYFKFDKKTGTITDYNKAGGPNVVIPSIIDGVTVTNIGKEAFSSKDLTSVIIPETVEEIGPSAFKWNNISSVTIPNSVKKIDDYAFVITNLESLTIGNNVKTIGYNAFRGNNLQTVVIPDSVVSIGDAAFLFNDLTSLTLGNSITRIGESAFSKNKLTSVYIPDSVTVVGMAAFNENKISSLYLGNGISIIGAGAFSYNEITSINLGNTVTVIGADAFYSNNLEVLTIPDGVNMIYSGAFSSNNLRSVTIGKNVTSIDKFVFSSNKLTEVTIPSGVKHISTWAFHENRIETISIGSNVTIEHDNSLGIYGGSFKEDYERNGRKADTYNLINNSWLKPVMVEGNYFTFDKAAGSITAYDTAGGLDVVIPREIDGVPVRRIGEKAFKDLRITSVIIPDSVLYLDADAFSGNKLTTVTIPESTIHIDYFAFSRNNLTTATIPDSVVSIGASVFDRNNLTSIHIGSGILEIGSFMYAYNDLTSIVIPDNIISIRGQAFGWNNLESITIGKNVWIDPSYPTNSNYALFVSYYEQNGRKEGIYIFENGSWKQGH